VKAIINLTINTKLVKLKGWIEYSNIPTIEKSGCRSGLRSQGVDRGKKRGSNE
jgi:hypothetical protein